MANWYRGGKVVDQGGEEEDDQEKLLNNNGGGMYQPLTLYESLEDQLNNLNLSSYPSPLHQQQQQQNHNRQNHLQDLYPDFPYGVVPFAPPPVLPPLPTVVPGSLHQQAPYVNELLSRNQLLGYDLGLPMNYRSMNNTARFGSGMGINDYPLLDTSIMMNNQGLRGGYVSNDFASYYRGNSLYPSVPIVPSSRLLYPEDITTTTGSRSRMRQFSNQVNVNGGFAGRNHHHRPNRSPSCSSGGIVSTNFDEEDRIRRNAEYYERIRNGDLHNWENLVDMAKDRYGSNFLQAKLESGSCHDVQFLIGVMTPHIKRLMVDPDGSLFVQKMFLKCTEGQIGDIVNILTNNGHELINICLDTHGTKSVQKLLESLTSGQQKTKVMNVLSRGTVELTKDTNGHHVIQQCLKTFSNEENKHLFCALAKNCVDIARDQNGCCVLQQFILHTDENLRDQFVDEITQNALVLAQDPYGNYVVQYVVGQRIKEATRTLAKNLKGHFETLSTNKFSSHLVEKFLKESGDEFVIKLIIDELLNKSNTLMLLQDQYANFVMQSVLNAAKEVSMFHLIVNVIEVNYQSLRNHPYGKRVVLHMNQLIRGQQNNHHHHQLQRHI